MEFPVLYVAIASTIAFTAYNFFNMFWPDSVQDNGNTNGHAVTDTDTQSGWDVLQYLSIQSFLLGVMGYSWSWIHWSGSTASVPLQVVGTFVSGSSMLYLYFYGMKLISRLNSPQVISPFIPVVGMRGTISLTVLVSEGGNGQVTLVDPARGDFLVTATTSSTDEIKTGESVIVTEVIDHHNVVVTRP